MTKSAEYPDLEFVPPKSWQNANRTYVQLIVIHTTEGHEHEQAAEDGASYDTRRTDGTSAHYFHDPNSTVQCVRTEDIAHTARRQGNRRGIHHELCGRAGQTVQQWDDDASNRVIRRAAVQAARDAKKWNIPVRRLTVAEVRSGVKGFCSHYDITRAFPEDGGTHTDPGPNFPWDEFLTLVRGDDDDMAFTIEEFLRYDPNDATKGIKNPYGEQYGGPTVAVKTAIENTLDHSLQAVRTLATMREEFAQLSAKVVAIGQIVGQPDSLDTASTDRIINGVLSGLSVRSVEELEEMLVALFGREKAEAIASRILSGGSQT